MDVREQTSDSSPIHCANIACYVIDVNTENVYGVTNRHVTLHAENIYIKQAGQNEQIKIGSSVKIPFDIPFDVGLIRIDKQMINRLTNSKIYNKRVSLYTDTFQSLYSMEVIKYKPNGDDFEITQFKTPNSGFIASKIEHQQFGVGEAQFLVKSSDSDFAKEGESGTAIAVEEIGGDKIELIGLLCGGSKGFTVCLFFPTLFEYLKSQCGFNIKLYEPDCNLEEFKNNKTFNVDEFASNETKLITTKKCIPFGLKIYFLCSTPEKIAPLEFDLCERVLSLLCKCFISVDLKNYEDIIKKEQHLSLLVSERNTLSENAIFENDRPEFVTVEMGIKACDSLYFGDAASAEKNLKQAVFCVMKSEEKLGLRLLCKLVSYVTWCLLEKNSPDSLNNLKRLLEESIDVFESDFKDIKGFPLETLGYMYYDFTRYYMALWENEKTKIQIKGRSDFPNRYRLKAVDKAKQAVSIFQDDHDKQNTKETERRLLLAKCKCIDSLLGCGESFDTCEDITAEELNEADNVFKSINVDIKNIPYVQNIHYLLSFCDLQFRKGKISKALSTAEVCLLKSKNKKYECAFNRANHRVLKLYEYNSGHKRTDGNNHS